MEYIHIEDSRCLLLCFHSVGNHINQTQLQVSCGQYWEMILWTIPRLLYCHLCTVVILMILTVSEGRGRLRRRLAAAQELRDFLQQVVPCIGLLK